jgi:hypothetical protein
VRAARMAGLPDKEAKPVTRSPGTRHQYLFCYRVV